jgi:lipid-A-disaccharide synthase
MAAGVLSEFRGGAFGIGGAAAEAAGLEALAPFNDGVVMGIGDVFAKLPALFRRYQCILRAVKQRRPKAALLIDYSSFNCRLLAPLAEAGVRTIWYGAPQVWAWRPRRAARFRSVATMATLFPFEPPYWKRFEVSSRWVGHPALEAPTLPRNTVEAALTLSTDRRRILVAPGSRPGELKRHAPVFLDAAAALLKGGAFDDGVLLLPENLPAPLRTFWEGAAGERGVLVRQSPLPLTTVAGAFDGALVATGTATLEVALAGVPMVAAHCSDFLTAFLGKRFLQIPYLALPNILLGRACIEELLQEQMTRPHLLDAFSRTSPMAASAIADELRTRLAPEATPSATVAALCTE